MKALQTRSPIHLYYNDPLVPNFNKVNLKIWLREDKKDLNVNLTPDYELSSEAINSEVIFEISELLRSVNQYEFDKNFYDKRDTSYWVLCEAEMFLSVSVGGGLFETRYNLFKIRDGYVERVEQTQILKSLISSSFGNWSRRNASIAFGQEDAFLGNNAQNVIRQNSGSYSLSFTVNQNTSSGLYTFSVYVKNASNTDIFLKINNLQVKFENLSVITTAGGLLNYDITELDNGYYRYAISGFFTRIQNVILGFNGNSEVIAFNPTLIKGDYINKTASDLILQDNYNFYSTENIDLKFLVEDKFFKNFYIDNSVVLTVNSKVVTVNSSVLNLNQGLTTEDNSKVIDAQTSFLVLEDIADVTTTQKITLNELCEPKYTPVKVSFINRFGVIQDLVFFKKRVDSYSTSEEDYKSNTITNGEVYPHLGQRRIYNKEAKASLKISSGFYPESFNTVFKQLLYSEMYWIDDEPAILTDSSWTEKTKVNDKLINYDFDFDFANDDINSIR